VVELATAIIKSTRPKQWIKNLALFAALIFSGNLFNQILFYKVVLAVFVFFLASSASYLLNDILDKEKDRIHPFKKNRPVAKGLITVQNALFLSIIFATTSLYIAILISFFLFLIILVYLLLQVFYSTLLKKMAVLDILVIAAGFVLRVFAGAFVINAHLSVWFLLCVISLSLFLAAGKRRAEIAVSHLSIYKPEILDSYLAMFGNAAWVSWSLFAFFESSPTAGPTLSILNQLPLTIAGVNKWLMLTIPIVIFGIMRYLKIIYDKIDASVPEKIFWADRQLFASVLIWVFLVIFIIYFPAD